MKPKLNNKIVTFVICLSILKVGCSKLNSDDETNYLTAKVSPNQAVILPVDDMVRCSSTTTKLSPNVLEFANVAISWQSANAFRLVSLSLEMKSPMLNGGKYQCTINGNELIALMPTRTIAADVACAQTACIISSSNFCTLRCGSVKLISGAKSAKIPAKIKMLGIETDTATDIAFPVTKEIPVTIIYKEY